MTDPRSWSPPAHPPTDPDRIPALNGSHLFAAGRYASEAGAVRAFLSLERPASLEIGFDHAMCLLDRARLLPNTLTL